MSGGTLLRYDVARRAVAEAKSIDEVSEWIDKAAAVREYGRRIKDRQIEIDAIEIRTRAKKRRGELVLALKAEGHLREGKPKLSSPNDSIPSPLTLDDLGITANESSEEQAIAKLDGSSFERLIARCRAYTEQHPDKHSFNVLKPPPEGAINGSRSIMGSRHEDIESLDYFPTPPWATRALMERVLPHLGIEMTGRVREPACGEGHIAEVLREYCSTVVASDIFDYGYCDEVADFLADDFKARANWFVTNPPFGDAALDFVDRALTLARTGIAFFVRTQWAVEGIERYERIFRDDPPTLSAYFVERVNLCKGRWEPDGSTATAYCWLVWIKDKRPRPPFYIPPGCRQQLERPGDRARFVAHPVIRAADYDGETGEVRA